MDYQKEYYNLIKERLDSFEGTIKSLEEKWERKLEKQDEKLDIQDKNITDNKISVVKIIYWGAGAGAVASLILTISMFLIGLYIK